MYHDWVLNPLCGLLSVLPPFPGPQEALPHLAPCGALCCGGAGQQAGGDQSGWAHTQAPCLEWAGCTAGSSTALLRGWVGSRRPLGPRSSLRSSTLLCRLPLSLTAVVQDSAASEKHQLRGAITWEPGAAQQREELPTRPGAPGAKPQGLVVSVLRLNQGQLSWGQPSLPYDRRFG